MTFGLTSKIVDIKGHLRYPVHCEIETNTQQKHFTTAIKLWHLLEYSLKNWTNIH